MGADPPPPFPSLIVFSQSCRLSKNLILNSYENYGTRPE